MFRDCHVAIPFAVVHNFSYLPYNNKKDIRIYFMAPYCSNRNTNCYCQNGNYRPQTRQENERQLHCNIPVPPLPEQKSKNYCCDECVGDYSKTDVLQGDHQAAGSDGLCPMAAVEKTSRSRLWISVWNYFSRA